MQEGQIVQVAHLVRDLDAALERYWLDFGMGPWDVYTYGPHNVKDTFYRGKPAEHVYRLGVTWQGQIQIEVIQPLTGYSIYDEFMEKHGEGMHHIKLYHSDCAKAIKDYEAKGYRVIQYGSIGEDVFYYLDSEERLGGAVLELGNAGSIPAPERRYPAS